VSHFDRPGAIRAVADNLRHGAQARGVERLADTFLACRPGEDGGTTAGPGFAIRSWHRRRSLQGPAAPRLLAALGFALGSGIAVRRDLAMAKAGGR
jgi:hypothetical protein